VNCSGKLGGVGGQASRMASKAIERLLDSVKSGKYYSAGPEEVQELYQLSQRYLYSKQGSLDEQTFYRLLQQHFHLALITGNDSAAKLSLQRLVDRFGEESSVIGVLKAQYLEMTESVEAAQKYLSSRDVNDYSAFKRKTVILKQNGNWKRYVEELLQYLDICPTDAEVWSEVAEAYLHLKLYDQAIHCLEEVVVLMPQAYNMFARMGEITHISATVAPNPAEQTLKLKDAVTLFLRSVELCPAYVRGWSGVYVVTKKLLSYPKLQAADKQTYQDLQAVAKSQLETIVKSSNATPENIEAANSILKL
jgi:tetratricopeptide (TPR) repeat protein